MVLKLLTCLNIASSLTCLKVGSFFGYFLFPFLLILQCLENEQWFRLRNVEKESLQVVIE